MAALLAVVRAGDGRGRRLAAEFAGGDVVGPCAALAAVRGWRQALLDVLDGDFQIIELARAGMGRSGRTRLKSSNTSCLLRLASAR